MKAKFFNILDEYSFVDKSEIEQKSILIKTKVYTKGKSTKVDINLEESEIWRGSNKYPKYLGQDFEFNGIEYKLNDDFLTEVYNECIQYIKFQQAPKIENYLETIKLQAEFAGDSFITEKLQNETNNYNINISRKLFRELHNSGFENEQQHFDILKNFLSFNWIDLFEYLIGLTNIQGYHIVSTYYNYVILNRIIIFLKSNIAIEEKDEILNSKFSRPKFIAMINELGLFKLESLKDLTNDQKAKIILALLQQDENNIHKIHNVTKNMQTLNSKSELNNTKYTAWTHMGDVRKILYNIIKKF